MAQASSLSTCLGKEGSVSAEACSEEAKIPTGLGLQVAVGPEAGAGDECNSALLTLKKLW